MFVEKIGFIAALVVGMVVYHYGYPKVGVVGDVLVRAAKGVCRRIISILVMTVLLVLVINSVASAEGKKYAAFTNAQAKQIEAAIKNDPDCRYCSDVRMKNVSWWTTKVEYWLDCPEEYVSFLVGTDHSMKVEKIYGRVAIPTAHKIEKKIGDIINPEPSR